MQPATSCNWCIKLATNKLRRKSHGWRGRLLTSGIMCAVVWYYIRESSPFSAGSKGAECGDYITEVKGPVSPVTKETESLADAVQKVRHVETLEERNAFVKSSIVQLFAEASGNRTLVASRVKDAFLRKVMIQRRWDKERLFCDLQRVGELVMYDVPSAMEKSFGPVLRKYLPTRKLLDGARYKNCAIISNSGAIRNSFSGSHIDSHELVVRLNTGPIVGYEQDVGSRPADLRVVNSLVVNMQKYDPKFVHLHLKELDLRRNEKHFLGPRGTNSSPEPDVLIWDRCCCGLRHFEACLRTGADGLPERTDPGQFDSRDGLSYFLARRDPSSKDGFPDDKLFMMKFDAPWNLWDVMQRYHPKAIVGHTPSSGFMAIVLLMRICDEVSAFEFVPSMRNVDGVSVCHYADTTPKEVNDVRTGSSSSSDWRRSAGRDAGNEAEDKPLVLCNNFGDEERWQSWHPVEAEKSLLYQMNVASDEEVFVDGVIRIPGFSQVNCDA